MTTITFNEIELTNKNTKAKEILGTDIEQISKEFWISKCFVKEILEEELNPQFYGILECLVTTGLIDDYIKEINKA